MRFAGIAFSPKLCYQECFLVVCSAILASKDVILPGILVFLLRPFCEVVRGKHVKKMGWCFVCVALSWYAPTLLLSCVSGRCCHPNPYIYSTDSRRIYIVWQLSVLVRFVGTIREDVGWRARVMVRETWLFFVSSVFGLDQRSPAMQAGVLIHWRG